MVDLFLDFISVSLVEVKVGDEVHLEAKELEELALLAHDVHW